MIKFTQSIRFRIIVACIVFALIVNLVFGFLLFRSVMFSSDEELNWFIQKQITKHIDEYKNNQKIETHFFENIFVGDDKEFLKYSSKVLDTNLNINKTLKENMEDSYHFLLKDGYEGYNFEKQNQEYYIYKAPIEKEKHLYLIIDISEFNATDNSGVNKTLNYFLISLIITLILAILIGLYIAKKVLSPLSKLSTNVSQIEKNRYKSEVEQYYHDEVGFLAKTIDSFVKRTESFIQREKAFTRDASHELRTPIASSQAALEVLKEISDDPKILKILKRIERANKNMTHLIETFLLMGREQQKDIKNTRFKLKELIDNSIDKNSYLLNSDLIKYENRIDKDLELNLHKEHLSIIIDNLIRNAFTHMKKGDLFIDATKEYILVSDTNEWFNDTKELGIGLNIVKKICNEQNWRLDISSMENEGTKIKIFF